MRPRGRLRLGGAPEAQREEKEERKPPVFAPKPSLGKPSGLRLPVERPRLRIPVPKPAEEKPVEKPAAKPVEPAAEEKPLAPTPAPKKPVALFPESNHVVVIPTRNRPGRLATLLESILENTKKFGYDKRIKIVVVDDSDAAEAARNQARVSTLEKKSGGRLELHYYDKSDQQRLVKSLEEQLALSGIDPKEFIYEEGNRKGFGGVRNMASLIAQRHAKTDSILTFLDDDTMLKNLVFKGGEHKLAYTKSFFHELDKTFAAPDVNMIGGEVTGDGSGGMFYRVSDGLSYLEKFFLNAREKSPRSSSDDAQRQMIGTVALPGLSMKDGLKKMGNLTAQLPSGRDRFRVITTDVLSKQYKFDKKTVHRTDLVPGANVSLRASVVNQIPYFQYKGLRGEDVIMSCAVNSLLGGVYIINNPVAHFRDQANRDVVRESIADMTCHPVIEALREAAGGKGSFVEALKAYSTDKAKPHVEGILYSYPGNRISIWQNRLPMLKQIIHGEKSAWWLKPEHANSMKKINSFLQHLETRLPTARRELHDSISADKVAQALRKYGRMLETWRQVTEAARLAELKERRRAA